MMIKPLSHWFESYPIAPLQIQYRPIPQGSLLWNDKPLLRHSFLVWDVENISVKCFDSIKALVKFTPEKLYAISKKVLSPSVLGFFEEHGFVLFENYPGSADEKIMKLIHMHQGCTHLILISSDSDFVPSVHRFLEHHYVQWIINDANKKRICMRVNLSHARLTLSTFVQKDTEVKRRALKTPKPYSKKRSLMRLLKHIVFVNEKENNDYKGETNVG